MTLSSQRLDPVTLENVVSFSEGAGPAKIDRYNRQKQVMVMCNLRKGFSERAIVAALDAAIARFLPDTPPDEEPLPAPGAEE